MSKVQKLRSLLKQRLAAAEEEEIFELFDRTIAEYEEELCRLKEEIERQRKLLEAVYTSEEQIQKTDVQQLLVIKEEVSSEQQVWSYSLDQMGSEHPHIKEEEEKLGTEEDKLGTRQEQEHVHELEEVDITEFPFTPVTVKCESEMKPQPSQLYQHQTGQNGEAEPQTSSSTEQIKVEDEYCGGSKPARRFHIDSHLHPPTEDVTLNSSESETEDSGDTWKEIWDLGMKVPVRNRRCNAGTKKFKCSECGLRLSRKGALNEHMRIHTGEKPFSCSECGQRYGQKGTLRKHMRLHTGDKPFSCSDCGQRFFRKCTLRDHMIIHTGEKPFSCSKCGRRFGLKSNLKTHMRIHTGEKPFSCSECDQSFSHKIQLQTHMGVHTGEKPFGCSECGRRFSQKSSLKRHMRIHTGKKTT